MRNLGEKVLTIVTSTSAEKEYDYCDVNFYSSDPNKNAQWAVDPVDKFSSQMSVLTMAICKTLYERNQSAPPIATPDFIEHLVKAVLLALTTAK